MHVIITLEIYGGFVNDEAIKETHYPQWHKHYPQCYKKLLMSLFTCKRLAHLITVLHLSITWTVYRLVLMSFTKLSCNVCKHAHYVVLCGLCGTYARMWFCVVLYETPMNWRNVVSFHCVRWPTNGSSMISLVIRGIQIRARMHANKLLFHTTIQLVSQMNITSITIYQNMYITYEWCILDISDIYEIWVI